MKILNGQIFDEINGFIEQTLYTSNGLFTSDSEDDIVLDATDCYIIPGLTDIHTHGCVGADTSDCDIVGLQKMAEYQLSRGVTQFCPTGMTLPAETLHELCRMIAEYKKNPQSGATVAGLHLEGPFLSYAKRGAQNGAWIQEGNAEMLQSLISTSQGNVKIVSVAPEIEGAKEMIEKLSDDVIFSLAHTEADYDTASTAFSNGARHVTHMFNAVPPYHHRNPGVIGAAFDCPHSRVELICDGIHLHPAVVRGTFSMFGVDRIILVSDSMRATGLEDGEYDLGGQNVTVNGSLATLADGTIAGSVTDLMKALQVAVSMGISLHHAVMATAVNPAKALGIFEKVGSLTIGKEANFVLLDKSLNIKTIVFKGKII